MANLRTIKKDIIYLTNEVISDAYMFMYMHKDKEKEGLGVINEASDLCNNLIARVNNPADKKDKKAVRTHYKDVKKDLLEGIDKLFSKLSGFAK